MVEIWKDVVDYEDFYEVSNLGNVRSKEKIIEDSIGRIKVFKSRILKKFINKKGYVLVSLFDESGHKKMVRVHRLVAQSFIPTEDLTLQVNHIDGVKTNNNINNLEWVTAKENIHHAVSIGLIGREVKCINTSEVFKSLKEASLKYNLSPQNISKCCRNVVASCGKHPESKEKLLWEYVS